jgi:hypothetical protein
MKAYEIEDFEPVVLRIENVLVRLDYIGEGRCEDYNPEDPDDIPLLRFSVYRKDEILDDMMNVTGYTENWEEIDDSSYCTCLSAKTSRKILRQVADVIMSNIFRRAKWGRENHPIKKTCEVLSHIDSGNLTDFASVEIMKALPAGHHDLQSKPYSCQNILKKQLNFPAKVFDTEELACVYSDRVYSAWEEGRKFVLKKMKTDYFRLEDLDDKTFMSWGRIIFRDWLKHNHRQLTGLRVVRHTNVSSGYPVMRIDGYSRKTNYPKVKTYSSSYDAPNIEQPEPCKGSLYMHSDGMIVHFPDE